MYAEWRKSIPARFNKEVVMLTGEPTIDIKLLAHGNVIVTTAEQFDNISRRWKTRKGIQAVKLFIVSDLHMVGATNGPVLEIVCSRMRYMASQLESKMRIIALSVSLSNARDIASWLSCTIYNFPPTARPIKLDVKLQVGGRMRSFVLYA